MTPEEEDLLIERLTTAHRAKHPSEVAWHPVFFDLSEAARERAFWRIQALREAEAMLDPEGLNSTMKAVLGRL
jgi:hypothetical protein